MTKPEHGIDIIRLTPKKVREILGQGDWIIALTDGLPDITITQEWRRMLRAFAAKQFVHWVIEGIDRTLSHDSDPLWDMSGTIDQRNVDSMLLLTRYPSLADWAENEHTGQSRATFVSGMGLWWETYHDDIESFVETQVYERLVAHCRPHLDLGDDVEVWEHELWDDVEDVLISLKPALVEDTLQMSTTAAWQVYESEVRAELEARRQQAEAVAKQQKQVRVFWQAHFPDLVNVRVERPQFREMNLEERITEQFADADPQILQLIAADMFLPGNYSNSVREWIREIALRALNDE